MFSLINIRMNHGIDLCEGHGRERAKASSLGRRRPVLIWSGSPISEVNLALFSPDMDEPDAQVLPKMTGGAALMDHDLGGRVHVGSTHPPSGGCHSSARGTWTGKTFVSHSPILRSVQCQKALSPRTDSFNGIL